MDKKLMITCDEATAISDKDQYGEATKWELFKLNLHLLMCKHCRAYSKQNTYISKLLGNYLDSGYRADKLLDKEKNEMRDELKVKIKELSKK
ncbi:MAG: hypothetical protein ABFR05_01965 [Bacteroidota bacterium]